MMRVKINPGVYTAYDVKTNTRLGDVDVTPWMAAAGDWMDGNFYPDPCGSEIYLGVPQDQIKEFLP